MGSQTQPGMNVTRPQVLLTTAHTLPHLIYSSGFEIAASLVAISYWVWPPVGAGST